MKRIVIFCNLPANAAARTTFIEGIKEIFPHNEEFRLNFYTTDHKEAELFKSIKSQSVKQPIDALFHQMCTAQETSKTKGKLLKNVKDFRFHFHSLDMISLANLKAKILERYKKEAAAHAAFLASRGQAQSKAA